MPTKITTHYANEQGTFIITCAFTDEDGDAVTPNSITWTLTDKDGNIINDRENVEVETPAASIDIVLSGDDLAIQSGETDALIERRLAIESVYDSDAGQNLPLKDEATFMVNNLVAVD